MDQPHRRKVTGVAGVFSFMVTLDSGDAEIVHIDPVNKQVYLPTRWNLTTYADQLEQDILAWLNMRPASPVNVPAEIQEAVERAKDATYQGDIPEAQ
jgi:hypothetical protein